jgi:hypothetical protein
MDFIDGHTVDKQTWRKMSWDKREKLVKDIARFQSEVYAIPFQTMGSLYQVPIESLDSSEPSYLSFIIGAILLTFAFSFPLGIVCVIWLHHTTRHAPPKTTFGLRESQFYLGPMISLDMVRGSMTSHRGPYSNTYDWFCSRLLHCHEKQQTSLKEALRINTEDSLDDAYDCRQIDSFVQDLLELLPKHISPKDVETSYHLLVPDLHSGNIMVDDDGDILAIIDWEFISSVPAWRSCVLPKLFLHRAERAEKPYREDYAVPTLEEIEDPDGFVEDGMNVLYWEHLLDYEMTVLRPVYWAEMERLNRSYVEEHNKNSLNKEFGHAIDIVEAGDLGYNRPYVWMDKLRRGEDTKGLLEGGESLPGYEHLVYVDVSEERKTLESVRSSYTLPNATHTDTHLSAKSCR